MQYIYIYIYVFRCTINTYVNPYVYVLDSSLDFVGIEREFRIEKT